MNSEHACVQQCALDVLTLDAAPESDGKKTIAGRENDRTGF